MKHLRLFTVFFLLGLGLTARAQTPVFDCVVAQDGTGHYANLQDAIDAAPAHSRNPYIIFVKRGRYHEHVFIPEDKSGLRIIGQGRDVVRIFDDRVSGGRNASPVDVAATVVCHAPDVYFEGITFENSWGTRMKDGPQALALYTKNDRIVVNRCAMLSYQDTYRTAEVVNGRNYVRDCFIEGAVDFIYGQGNVYFDSCTLNIVRKEGGFIVATKHEEGTRWGYVFRNATITAPGHAADTQVWLGRPWLHKPMAVFIDTRAEVTIPPEGWYDHMSTLPKVYADYGTTDGNGRPLDLSRRISRYYKVEGTDTLWGDCKSRLTDAEAATYTIDNVLGGDDGWQPQQLCMALLAPRVTVKGRTLVWAPVRGARGYVVEHRGRVVAVTADCRFSLPADTTGYCVRTVSPNGSLSMNDK